jgi:hypothetical protein
LLSRLLLPLSYKSQYIFNLLLPNKMLSLKGFSCKFFNIQTKKHSSRHEQQDSIIATMQEIEIDKGTSTLSAFAEVSSGPFGVEVLGSKDVCSHAMM